MSLIDSRKSNSYFKSISVGSQIIHYIENIANEILHLLGRSWRQFTILYRVIYQKKKEIGWSGRKVKGKRKRKEEGEWRGEGKRSEKTERRDGEGRKGGWEWAGRSQGNERGKGGKGTIRRKAEERTLHVAHMARINYKCPDPTCLKQDTSASALLRSSSVQHARVSL